MKKATTTKQINEAITNGLLQITKAECSYKSSNRIDEISKETFKENLQFLCESGIFVAAIGWHYERYYKSNDYIVECGRMNPDTEIIIAAYLSVCDDMDGEDLEKALLFVEE